MDRFIASQNDKSFSVSTSGAIDFNQDSENKEFARFPGIPSAHDRLRSSMSFNILNIANFINKLFARPKKFENYEIQYNDKLAINFCIPQVINVNKPNPILVITFNPKTTETYNEDELSQIFLRFYLLAFYKDIEINDWKIKLYVLNMIHRLVLLHFNRDITPFGYVEGEYKAICDLDKMTNLHLFSKEFKKNSMGFIYNFSDTFGSEDPYVIESKVKEMVEALGLHK